MQGDTSLLRRIGRPRSFAARYGIALLAVLAGTAIRIALDIWIPNSLPFAFHFLAVLVAASAGGFGPGIFATLLSAPLTWALFVKHSAHIDLSRISAPADLPTVADLSAIAQNSWPTDASDAVNLAVFLLLSILIFVSAATLRGAIIRQGRSERELQKSERRFRALADAMPHLVWSAGADGKLDYCNQRFLDFTGQTKVGESWKTLLHPDDEKRTRAVWKRARESAEPYEIEYRFRDKNGRYHWLLCRAVPVKNGEGKVERWFGSSTDISDIVTAREALARGKEEQERIVATRTAELNETNARLRAEILERARAEEALRQAHKMEALGHLTGGVAHDFNNLLTVVIGNVEAIQRRLGSNGDAAIRSYTEFAMQGAKRAAGLTQRLLAFARGQPLEPKSTDINKLLSGMSELFARTLGEHIAMKTVFARALWPTAVDPNQLESVLLNLAANSRDAMPEGGTFTIETGNAYLNAAPDISPHPDVMPGEYVLVSVSDTGIGMSRETLARVFEPFFTTKPLGQGTGLGLSQLYGFVKQSGGHVDIESDEGKGTAVKIYLPRLSDEIVTEGPKAEEVAPESESQETVLAVEDDEDVRRYAVGMLRELGYNVIEAADGAAALRLIETHPDIRFLFTDVGLPGGYNGRELANEALKRRPYLKVLFTTGYGRDGIIHEGRLDPGVQLITKPFTFDEFADKIRKVFDMTGKGTILLVEDEALVAMVAAETLRDLGFKVEEAGTAAAALNVAQDQSEKLSAAIIDINLPDGKGDELAKKLRALKPDLPIVIATGAGDKTLANELKKGAPLALLSKPYDSGGLRRSLAAVGLG
ncbi:MAG TPA: response regulator [Xanthobacteraceae bacterium]|nr:response regulator [Xanthobacteraceae bacterium]